MIKLLNVPKIGLEPTRPYGHYTLNVARLPISPLGQLLKRKNLFCAQDKNRTCTPVTGTWPSTMRVYQFRHLGLKAGAKLKLFLYTKQ